MDQALATGVRRRTAAITGVTAFALVALLLVALLIIVSSIA